MLYGAAREMSGSRRTRNPSIVRMTFIGYDEDGNPAFTFFYPERDPDEGLPVHDHRDNFHGGFAFAVFHPGTSLPQQPWAL